MRFQARPTPDSASFRIHSKWWPNRQGREDSIGVNQVPYLQFLRHKAEK